MRRVTNEVLLEKIVALEIRFSTWIEGELKAASIVHTEQGNDIKELKRDMWGNGHEGVTTRLDRIEDAHEKMADIMKQFRNYSIAAFFTLIVTAVSSCAGSFATEVAKSPTVSHAENSITPAPVTATASPTVTPAPTLTSSIIEVTPQPTKTIIEVGPIVTELPPGVIVVENGTYTPKSLQNVRECPSVTCAIIGKAGGQVPVRVGGWLKNEVGQVWVCLEVHVDQHGAQVCAGALLYQDAAGMRLGVYEKTR